MPPSTHTWNFPWAENSCPGDMQLSSQQTAPSPHLFSPPGEPSDRRISLHPWWLKTAKTGVPSLGWEDPLEKRMAAHSSILAWRIPWTEAPGGLQSMGSQRVTLPLSRATPKPCFLFPELKKKREQGRQGPLPPAILPCTCSGPGHPGHALPTWEEQSRSGGVKELR